MVEEDDEPSAMADQTYAQLLKNEIVTKKTRKRKQKLAKALRDVHRQEKKKSSREAYDYSALHMINDPQSYAEKVRCGIQSCLLLLAILTFFSCQQLFRKLKGSTDRFEVKLMIMNFLSRLIGVRAVSIISEHS